MIVSSIVALIILIWLLYVGLGPTFSFFISFVIFVGVWVQGSKPVIKFREHISNFYNERKKERERQLELEKLKGIKRDKFGVKYSEEYSREKEITEKAYLEEKGRLKARREMEDDEEHSNFGNPFESYLVEPMFGRRRR